jgi:hypothetical protein
MKVVPTRRGPASPRRARIVLVTAVTALIAFACRDVTAPEHGPGPQAASHLLNPTGSVVVLPDSMRGWAFYDDQRGVACGDTIVCRMTAGPVAPPAGTGSAELATTAAADGNALILSDYQGTRFDSITALTYSTYRQSADAGNNLSIALQFNVDYDLTDASATYQGRIVYEPYQANGGGVAAGTWTTWDTKAGRWWGTRATVMRGGVATTNPCVQATPCTWTALLAAFPDAGVHATYGAVVLKAGSGWASFRGNVDNLTIGIGAESTTFDFELTAPAPASFKLMVLRDPEVTGTPAASDTSYAVGTAVSYSFQGPTDGRLLTVYLDDSIVPPSGTLQMNAEHALFVAVHPDMTLQAGDQSIYNAIRAVLTAADPHAAVQDLMNVIGRSYLEVGEAETGARVDRAYAAAIDINRDSASLARVSNAVGGHVFDVNFDAPAGGATPSRSSAPASPVADVRARRQRSVQAATHRSRRLDRNPLRKRRRQSPGRCDQNGNSPRMDHAPGRSL